MNPKPWLVACVNLMLLTGSVGSAMAADETSPKGMFLVAMTHLEVGDYAAAEKAAHAVVKTEDPRNVSDLYRRASLVKFEALLGQAKLDEAANVINLVWPRFPDDIEVTRGRLRLALRVAAEAMKHKEFLTNIELQGKFSDVLMTGYSVADRIEVKMALPAEAHLWRAKLHTMDGMRLRMIITAEEAKPATNAQEKNEIVELFRRRIAQNYSEAMNCFEAATKPAKLN
jgi:hypothetical protein